MFKIPYTETMQISQFSSTLVVEMATSALSPYDLAVILTPLQLEGSKHILLKESMELKLSTVLCNSEGLMED